MGSSHRLEPIFFGNRGYFQALDSPPRKQQWRNPSTVAASIRSRLQSNWQAMPNLAELQYQPEIKKECSTNT